MTLLNRFLLVVVLQTLVLFAMIGYRQWTLSTGTVIRLETSPIDPRSLFAGDYVNFAYKIGVIPIPKTSEEKFNRNETVYVVLTPKDDFWVVDSVHKIKPTVSSPEIVIKGRVEYVNNDKINVLYGIENYFIPEGKGRDIERPESAKDIVVKVAVDRFGNAAIYGVYVKDEEIYQEKLF
jgi:uncharacterized membrane-anchored protein